MDKLHKVNTHPVTNVQEASEGNCISYQYAETLLGASSVTPEKFYESLYASIWE